MAPKLAMKVEKAKAAPKAAAAKDVKKAKEAKEAKEAKDGKNKAAKLVDQGAKSEETPVAEVYVPKSNMTAAEWSALQEGMDEKWPAPAYMSENTEEKRGHTNYRDETYSIITRWSAETKISYRPHAKRPGSKSHDRYESYSLAKTVGEALALGSYPVDWCWDYERGFVKVEGPVRDEPLDITKVMNDDELTPVDLAINGWYRRELAKNLGLSYKDLAVGKGGSESMIMRAHRLVAQREAKQFLELAAKEGRWVTDDEVLKTLTRWAFARNVARTNVMPGGQDWVWSDTLGLLRDRCGDIHLTTSSRNYPEVVQLLNKYLEDRLPEEMKDFRWTTLNLNCNYAARQHRDGNNFGPSFIKAFGPCTGGRLNYWPEDDRKVDNLDDLKSEDFTGHRYSVVYFTAGCHEQAPEECKQRARDVGFHYPSADTDRYALLRPPRGYTSPSAATSTLPTFRYYPSAEIEAAQKKKKSAGRSARPLPTPLRQAESVARKRAEPGEAPKAKRQRSA